MPGAKKTQEQRNAEWREAKQAEWDAGGKLKAEHPTQESLDWWMDQKVKKVDTIKVFFASSHFLRTF